MVWTCGAGIGGRKQRQIMEEEPEEDKENLHGWHRVNSKKKWDKTDWTEEDYRWVETGEEGSRQSRLKEENKKFLSNEKTLIFSGESNSRPHVL